jgi:acyl-coenzyme A synthetase/AMP-(fatty) acid ligase/3-hydroxymyristoyl/3-hydroxydecanoyl-(acyl carrier protein) dehydratase
MPYALADLLSRARSHDHVVCVDGAAELRFSAFRARVLGAAAQLRARDGVRRYALCMDDPYEFACALFAVLAAGHHPVIPASSAPGHLDELAGRYDVALSGLADLAGAASAAALTPRDAAASAPDGADGEHHALGAVPLDLALPLTLYTSGSSGTPKEIGKTLGQFAAEVATLQQQWGAEVAGAVVLTSVPHQHIYGLLFRLLWPLASDRAFDRAHCIAPAELFARVAALRDTVVVSSPAHLARWPQLAELAQLQPAPRRFFSSGAPLAQAAADHYTAAFGAAPIEIYGSTETGGIAWRCRSVDDAWQAFAGIELAAHDDGVLQVRSPHLGHAQWHRTDDAVEFVAAQRFHLAGRRDRIAKIEGKRVSLPALEARLEQHAYVAQAALALLHDARRERLGAALVLSADGAERVRSQGAAQLVKTLRRYLAQYVDPVVLPRRWRCVPALPYDARGKLPAPAVAALFERDPWQADVLAELREGETVLYELRVPPGLRHFDGHFPGLPILPGVIQVDWAVRLAQRHFNEAQRFRALERLKFMRPVGPGDLLRLNLVHEAARCCIGFTFAVQGQPCASGRIVYEAAL